MSHEFTGECYQAFKKGVMSISYHLFQTEAEVVITHYRKLTKYQYQIKGIIRKLLISIAYEHRHKNVQQMLANQI